MAKLFTGLVVAIIFITSACQQSKTNDQSEAQGQEKMSAELKYGGYVSAEKWGEHLVTISGCNDCHTPKLMTARGPVLDSSLLLSGHPAQMSPPDVDRKEMERKGLSVTNTLTSWVGPWGISFAANLTPDETGIGNWTESNFIRALREGKFKGLENGRPLLPPMPWAMYQKMSDDEIKAVFAYLKSIKPVKNAVPQFQPPVLSAK